MLLTLSKDRPLSSLSRQPFRLFLTGDPNFGFSLLRLEFGRVHIQVALHGRTGPNVTIFSHPIDHLDDGITGVFIGALVQADGGLRVVPFFLRQRWLDRGLGSHW